MRNTRMALIPALLTTLSLAGCNGSGSAEAQSLGNDWVKSDPAPTPAPTASATPTPEPSASPTPTDASGLYDGPAEVAKFVAKFVDDAKIQGRDVLPDMKNPKLQIQLASLDSYGSSVIGLCETASNLRRVTFDPDFWNSVSDTQKELLAHHELGHCVLYRSHLTTVLASGIYASIMYPYIMASATYLNNYDYYQKELFSQELMDPAETEQNKNTTHICNLEDLVVSEQLEGGSAQGASSASSSAKGGR